MTRDEVIRLLREANPRARADEVAIYADAFLEYLDARSQVAKRGLMVVDDGGRVIPNPFLAIRDKAGKTMREIRLKTDSLWRNDAA